MKKMFAFLLILGNFVPFGYSAPSENIDLNIECVDAYYESDTFGTPQYVDIPYTQSYFGLSGDRERSRFLAFPIILTLRFDQDMIEGEYTFVDNRKTTIHIQGRVDSNGHLVLHETTSLKERVAYTFQGKLTDQKEIVGMWMIGYDRDGFSFFATPDKHSRWLKPVTFLDVQDILLHATDRYGNTYIHVFARHHQRKAVEALLEEGAEVNVRNEGGQTPLHKAVDWKRSDLQKEKYSALVDIVNLLLNNGADVNVRDHHGVTPLDIAQHNDLQEVVELLRKFRTKKESL